jgi:hypothetical protein
MSKNCNITNISPGVSIIETYIDKTSFIRVTNNNNNIINPVKINDENYVCYYLSNFSYNIDILQDVSLNYALFGGGAPGDNQILNSTYISGVTKTISYTEGKQRLEKNDWSKDTRIYDISLNLGYGGANGALAYGTLPCTKNKIIQIVNNSTSLQLDYNNQYLSVGNGIQEKVNNIFKGTGGSTIYSNNWSYNKNYINGTNKLDSNRDNMYNIKNSTGSGPNNISINSNIGNYSKYTTPFLINNNYDFFAYGGNTNIVIGPPSNFKHLTTIQGNKGSDIFALIYYYYSIVSYYNLTNNDTKLYINTSNHFINIYLNSKNFLNGYTCEIINIENPINNIIINSDTQNIIYNYNTTLIQSQTILLRNIKLIFLNSKWYCSAY